MNENFTLAKRHLNIVIGWMILGGIIGVIMAAALSMDRIYQLSRADIAYVIFLFTIVSAAAFAFVPLLVCVWYFFLGMISQVSKAVKGE